MEFTFDEAGPSRSELPAVVEFAEFIGPLANESEGELWERLRGCSGIGVGRPFGQTEMKRLHARQCESDLRVTVCTIGAGDYLVLTPSGDHFGWMGLLRYRRPVVERMLNAGVPVVQGHLD